jgi:hypothetical protein
MNAVTLDDMLAVATPQDVLDKIDLSSSPLLDQLARSCAKVTNRPHVNVYLYSATEVYTLGSYNPLNRRTKRTIFDPILNKPFFEFADISKHFENAQNFTHSDGEQVMRAFSVATIKIAGETVGGVSAYDFVEREPLTETQKEFLINAANLASCVIETKARLKTTLMNAFSLANF